MAEEVIVDPRCDLRYYTMLFQGFADLEVRVRFQRLEGPEGTGMALRCGERRVWIAANDMAELEPAARSWANAIWKVNLDNGADYGGDVRPAGPMFGIRAWKLPLGYRLVAPLLRCGVPPRRALAQLRFQGLTRLPMSAYEHAASDPSFLFMRAREWKGRHAGANSDRKMFMEATASLSLNSSQELAEDRIDLFQYLSAMRRSVVAFNSPAVHHCLGWKLGEFLALGKAIVSTPLDRQLPEPLVHGEHIHYVGRDKAEMRAAVERIAADDGYRRRLEQGALGWFDRNLRPDVLAMRVLSP